MADRILVWIERLPGSKGMDHLSSVWDFDIDDPEAYEKWTSFSAYVQNRSPGGVAKMAWYEDWGQETADSIEEGHGLRIAGEAIVLLEERSPS